MLKNMQDQISKIQNDWKVILKEEVDSLIPALLAVRYASFEFCYWFMVLECYEAKAKVDKTKQGN